jgi:hypothetical protein
MNELEALRKIYELIHPDTTPDGNEFSDGEILDMVFETVKPFMQK